jgi:hypothetical protein
MARNRARVGYDDANRKGIRSYLQERFSRWPLASFMKIIPDTILQGIYEDDPEQIPTEQKWIPRNFFAKGDEL